MTARRIDRAGPSLKDLLLSGEVWFGVLVLAVCQVSLPDSTRFVTALYNSGHAPLFGAAALAALSALTRYAPRAAPLQAYGLAAAIAFSLGVATEALQAFGGRNAEVGDLVRDALGIGGFLVTRAAFDERVLSGGRGRRFAMCVAGAVLVVAGMAPVLRAAALYAARADALPDLVDFSSPRAAEFLKTKDAVLDVRCAPEPESADGAECHGDLVLLPAEYPSLIIEEPYPDWRGYSALTLVVYGSAPPFDLTLRIDDMAHNGDYRDRFNTVLKVQEGRNEFSVPLSAVQAAPESRELDLAHVNSVVLFAAEPQDVHRISIDTIRLN